jgi:hypothetical protein
MVKRFSWIIGIVLVANAGALALVARNANGVPDAVVTLTEREMRVTNVGTDSTGMTLSLQWNHDAATEWFDRAKLAAIGFDCSIDPEAQGAEDHYYGLAVLPRAVYVVLEYDPGRVPEVRPQPADGRGVKTVPEYDPRLTPIDAGSDPQALRAKYPDRHRHIVTSGVVRALWSRPSPQERPRLRGRVIFVLPGEVYVPQDLQRTVLAALGAGGNRESPGYPLLHAPRYEVTVEYGSGLLPRAVGARALSTVDGRR